MKLIVVTVWWILTTVAKLTTILGVSILRSEQSEEFLQSSWITETAESRV